MNCRKKKIKLIEAKRAMKRRSEVSGVELKLIKQEDSVDKKLFETFANLLFSEHPMCMSENIIRKGNLLLFLTTKLHA